MNFSGKKSIAGVFPRLLRNFSKQLFTKALANKRLLNFQLNQEIVLAVIFNQVLILTDNLEYDTVQVHTFSTYNYFSKIKNYHFLHPEKHTCVCVAGGKKSTSAPVHLFTIREEGKKEALEHFKHVTKVRNKLRNTWTAILKILKILCRKPRNLVPVLAFIMN